MKKIILVLVFQFIITGTNAQDKTTPTKQETMDWIAGKMKQYLQTPRIFVSYSNGIFIYKKPLVDAIDENKICGFAYTTIDLNLVSREQGYNDENKTLKSECLFGNKLIVTKSVMIENYTVPEDEIGNYVYLAPLNNYRYTDAPYHDVTVFDLSIEYGLIERVRKACANLVLFNTQQNTSEKY